MELLPILISISSDLPRTGRLCSSQQSAPIIVYVGNGIDESDACFVHEAHICRERMGTVNVVTVPDQTERRQQAPSGWIPCEMERQCTQVSWPIPVKIMGIWT